MRRNKVMVVQSDLKRFQEALIKVESECKRIEKEYKDCNSDLYEVMHCVSPTLTGALRRASLDLTRSLAEMRKP